MISPPKVVGNEGGDVMIMMTQEAAKGAIKYYMRKAMNAVAAVSSSNSGGIGGDMDDDIMNDANARTPVICFKLLDLGKVRSESSSKKAPVASLSSSSSSHSHRPHATSRRHRHWHSGVTASPSPPGSLVPTAESHPTPITMAMLVLAELQSDTTEVALILAASVAVASIMVAMALPIWVPSTLPFFILLILVVTTRAAITSLSVHWKQQRQQKGPDNDLVAAGDGIQDQDGRYWNVCSRSSINILQEIRP